VIDPVPKLLRLLGEPVVLIDWPKGTKGNNKRRWGRLRPSDMTPGHLGRLKDGNIGVALGEVSGGLCAIDCDTDVIGNELIACNPSLNGTLQTHGARGRVFWLRFDKNYPTNSTKLKTKAGEVGEFRTNGNQSIVWGTHPKGMEYRFLIEQPAMRIEFGSIAWPPVLIKHPLYRADRETEVIPRTTIRIHH
jgi:hypothetical protein